MKDKQIMCCIVRCKKEAEFEVCYGNEVSDISEVCASHIGELVNMGDSRGRKVNSFTAHRIRGDNGVRGYTGMPCHADVGDEDCCGIFMIPKHGSIFCNECNTSINVAIKLLKIKEGDTVKVRASLEGQPDEIHKVIRNTDGKLALDDVMGTALGELNPEAIQIANYLKSQKVGK